MVTEEVLISPTSEKYWDIENFDTYYKYMVRRNRLVAISVRAIKNK